MAPLKLICEVENMRRDGTSIIFIQYCYSAEHRNKANLRLKITDVQVQ